MIGPRTPQAEWFYCWFDWFDTIQIPNTKQFLLLYPAARVTIVCVPQGAAGLPASSQAFEPRMRVWSCVGCLFWRWSVTVELWCHDSACSSQAVTVYIHIVDLLERPLDCEKPERAALDQPDVQPRYRLAADYTGFPQYPDASDQLLARDLDTF